MAFLDVPTIALTRGVADGHALIRQASNAAERGKSIRLPVDRHFLDSLRFESGVLWTAMEACEKFGSTFALVEQRCGAGPRHGQSFLWLWIGTQCHLTWEDLRELGRVESLLESTLDAWDGEQQTRTVRLKTAKKTSDYPSLTLLNYIRTGFLGGDGDPRLATAVFLVTELKKNYRWDIRIRPL